MSPASPSPARRVATLLELSKDRGAVVYAWSVLPDHLHLLMEGVFDSTREGFGFSDSARRQVTGA